MGVHLCWTMLDHPKILQNPVAEDCLHHIQEIHISLSHHLHNPQATYKKYADSHPLDLSRERPEFQVGDHV